MLNKEKTCLRDEHFLQCHPLLQARMRAVLLDWLMEVCEVYKLHRETFYLAQDFFDRYMASPQNIIKTLLQLIGISALFIASKPEEIYPTELHPFASVTDGACSGDEILTMELMMMKALKWHLSPLTIVSWLNVYGQVAQVSDTGEVLLPQYPQQVFVQIAELLDLYVLDVGCLEFPYGVLTASALYHFFSLELKQKVSGYQWCDIENCVKWMVPLTMVIWEMGSSKLNHFRGVPVEGSHNIQAHTNSLDLLDKAQAKKAILSEQNRIFPPPSGVLTPPTAVRSRAVSRRQNDQTCHRLQRQWCGSSCLQLPVLPWRSGAPADAVLWERHISSRAAGAYEMPWTEVLSLNARCVNYRVKYTSHLQKTTECSRSC